MNDNDRGARREPVGRVPSVAVLFVAPAPAPQRGAALCRGERPRTYGEEPLSVEGNGPVLRAAKSASAAVRSAAVAGRHECTSTGTATQTVSLQPSNVRANRSWGCT